MDDDQLLHFDKDGEFINNLHKRGQGPGEIAGLFNYCINKKYAYIYDFGTRNFFRMDYSGNYLGSIGPSKKILCNLIGVTKDALVIVEIVGPQVNNPAGKYENILRKVKLLSFDGQEENEIYAFKQKIFMAGNTTRFWGESIEVLSKDGENIFGFHGSDYLVEIINIDKRQVMERFTRPYIHVKHFEGERERDYRNKYNADKVEYDADINDVLVDTDKIWVETSEHNAEKGNLFDVVDHKGRFVESIYIGAGKKLLAVQGETFYVLEKDADNNYQIVIYQRLR